jgi:hypothetical protein
VCCWAARTSTFLLQREARWPDPLVPGTQ